jgi:carbamoylphosphate synthase large subunit
MKIFLPGSDARTIRILKETKGVEEVILSQSDPAAYGNFIADRAYAAPRFDEHGYLHRLKEIYAEEQFDVCLPVLDSALVFLARQSERSGGVPFRLAMNDSDTVKLAADKLAVHGFFTEHGIPGPKTWTLEEYEKLEVPPLPAFLKPRFIEMRVSDEALYRKLEDHADIEYYGRKFRGSGERFVVQEYLEGTHMNVDFFCDADGIVRSVVALKRLGMGAGGRITRGEIIEAERFVPFVATIARHAQFWGANQLQGVLDHSGSLRFTEINARLSGSAPFIRAAGVDFFAALVDLLEDRPVRMEETPRPLKMTSWENQYFYESSPLIQ